MTNARHMKYQPSWKRRAAGLWQLGLVFTLGVMTGCSTTGRLVGVGMLWKSAKFPAVPGLTEEYRAVVLTKPNTWVEFKHEGRNIGLDDAVARIEKAMQTLGYEKRDEKSVGPHSERKRVQWLLFTSADSHFCYSLILSENNADGLPLTTIDTTYKLFSERAYLLEKQIGKHLGWEYGLQ